MPFRTDITVDWSVSPRIITIGAPSTNIVQQDLYDTLAELQARAHEVVYPRIIRAGGKDALGGVALTAVTNTLLDAKIKFEDRAGPSLTVCTVTGGNLANPDVSVEASDYVFPIVINETGGTVAETGVSGLTAPESAALFGMDAKQDALDTKMDTTVSAAQAAETSADSASTNAAQAAADAAQAATDASDAATKAEAARVMSEWVKRMECNRAVIENNPDGTQTVTIYGDDKVTPMWIHTVDATRLQRDPVTVPP